MNALRSFIVLIVSLTILVSCSGGNRTPVTTDSQSPDLPDSLGVPSVDTNRDVLAVYDAVIDPVAGTFTVTPVERAGAYHFPLNQYYPNVLKVVGYGYTPNFWADIKLTHPYPGSGIDGFDPRVIAILPANPGVRFIYPILGVGGNNSVVLEPDGYTKLFDELGGSILGNVNPFKAYFKGQSYRRWSSTVTTQETQRWQMNRAGFGGPMQFKLVVDVSTNYPNPPQPVIDNAPEPVEIYVTDVGQPCRFTSDGGSMYINVTLLDWQGGIGGVVIEAPDLFNGTVSFGSPGGSPPEYTCGGTIYNEKHAPEGEYKFLVFTWDQVTGISMYREFVVIVSDAGKLIWAKGAGGSDSDRSYGITTLSDNSTVVTGQFYGSATFGQGEINQTVLTSTGVWDSDIFIARYNPDGTLAWAKRAGGSVVDSGYGITALSDNTIVVTGYFGGSATFGQGEPNHTVLTSAGGHDIFIARYNSDGTLAWAKRAGGSSPSYGDEGQAITTLSDNSTVVTGYFGGSATFGKSEANQTVLTSAGNYDIFIALYNPDGTLSWAKRAGGSGDDSGYGITTLSDNSTVVTGSFFGTSTFGPGEPNQTVLTSVVWDDIFIARYNPDGTLAWAKRAGGSIYDDYGYAITSLSDNSTVVTGYFYGSATFGEGEPNQTVLTSAGGESDSDIFIARYNSDGTLAWAKRTGGADHDDIGHGITTLSDDSTVVTGTLYGSATFYYDIFIARYNPDGTIAWTRGAGGSGFDSGYGITTLSDNSTVVTGEFAAYGGTFGPCEPNQTGLGCYGATDIFIARYHP